MSRTILGTKVFANIQYQPYYWYFMSLSTDNVLCEFVYHGAQLHTIL